MTIDAVDGGSAASLAGVYEAAVTGSVATLDTLLKRYGRVILHRVSLTSLVETPLHLAALLGHLEFSKRLLELKPDLATEQDSEKCTPLHLAAANGHDHVVRELMKGECQKACLVQDQEGRTPLHLAAMRGRVQVVQELLKSKHGQQTVKMKVKDGDSVLHLCVKHNHLDVLKAVVDSTTNDGEVLKMTDSRGNTVLHLAVMLKHKETVSYLVELPRVQKEAINTSNGMGFTAVDVLNNLPKDFKSLEIHEILVGVAQLGHTVRPSTALSADHQWKRIKDGSVEKVDKQKQVVLQDSTWWKHPWQYVMRLLTDYRDRENWMDETKNSLMMVSSIIATATFTAGISPPGGVWQEDTTSTTSPCNTTTCLAGTAVHAYTHRDKYMAFMLYNMISFFGSLVVIFLLVSGFPLRNKFCLWVLSLVMCITLTFLGFTFLESMWLVIPHDNKNIILGTRYDNARFDAEVVWYIMLGICGLFLYVRLTSWLDRKLLSWLDCVQYFPSFLEVAFSRLKAPFSSMSEGLQVTRYARWTTNHQAETSRC